MGVGGLGGGWPGLESECKAIRHREAPKLHIHKTQGRSQSRVARFQLRAPEKPPCTSFSSSSSFPLTSFTFISSFHTPLPPSPLLYLLLLTSSFSSDFTPVFLLLFPASSSSSLVSFLFLLLPRSRREEKGGLAAERRLTFNCVYSRGRILQTRRLCADHTRLCCCWWQTAGQQTNPGVQRVASEGRPGQNKK